MIEYNDIMRNLFFKKVNVKELFLLMLAAGSGIIWIFTNVSVDATYQITMAYRIINGEKWFLEMWEPHQTSAYLNALLMLPFIKIASSTTGVVLYLQAMGILIRAIVTIALYKTIKADVKKEQAFAISLLLFMISPKDLAVPEYGNQQLWFYTLLFVSLLKYLKTNKTVFVFLMSLCTCFLVLSYPSCIVTFIATVMLLFVYAKNNKTKIIGFYVITCAVIGVLYSLYVILPMGTDTFRECVRGMLALEPSHTVSVSDRLNRYWNDLKRIILFQGCVAVFALLLERIIVRFLCKNRGREIHIALFTVVSGIVMLCGFLVNILSVENRCDYGIIIFYFIIEGILLSHRLVDWEKTIYVIGTTISITCFAATLALTNLPVLVSSAYAVLGLGMALLPISRVFEMVEGSKLYNSMILCGMIFIFLLFLRAVYIRTPILGRSQITSIKDEMGLVRVGPARGIVTDEISAVKERDGYIDFITHVQEDDVVLVISDLVNSLTYLYTDMEIGAPSVISDPKWMKSMLEYYEMNPHKYPNVLAVSSYQGEIDYGIRSKEWIYGWITNEYGATRVEEGTWWTFYYRD